MFIRKDDQWGYEHGLPPIQKTSIYRIHGDLGLPESHVSDKQPIHGNPLFKIAEYLIDRSVLVDRVIICERFPESSLLLLLRDERDRMGD